ncbi:MAG: hypothetical protein Ct9H90mP18_05060 [Gammaproteobacteria bacterium]|nr:MAG: hypothetical protein Ct9H90mP18_05060 [Gammaproteobacteria bacterium]
MEIFLFYILTGLAGGLIGGFLGLGGGIVFVPSLLLIFTSYNIYEGYELSERNNHIPRMRIYLKLVCYDYT